MFSKYDKTAQGLLIGDGTSAQVIGDETFATVIPTARHYEKQHISAVSAAAAISSGLCVYISIPPISLLS